MAIFDSTKVHYLTYYVHLTSAEEIAEHEALLVMPSGLVRVYNLAPKGEAETRFNAPFRGFTEPAAGEAPFIWTPWQQDQNTGRPYPVDVRTFEVHTGGFLGIGGTTIRYKWVAEFKLASEGAGDASVDPDEEANVPKRRWVEGFETPFIGAITGTLGTAGLYYSKDASRHAGGIGLAYRGANNGLATIQTNAFMVPVDRTKTWERFYIRLRRLPEDTEFFWKWNTTITAAIGMHLAVTATGQVAVYNQAATGTPQLVQVIANLTLEEWNGRADHDVWRRIDIILNTQEAASSATTHIYVDGELHASITTPTGPAYEHGASRFGSDLVATDNGLYLDIDDWINSEWPTRIIDGVETLKFNGKDWLNGSMVRALRPTGLVTSADWTGDLRVLLQQTFGTQGFTPFDLTTSTSGAVLEVSTDSDLVIDQNPNIIGVAAIMVSMLGRRGAASGTLGYSLAGAAAVDAAIVQGGTNSAQSLVVSNFTNKGEGGGRPVLADVTPVTLRHVKGAGADAAAISQLWASAELLGKFGPEDYKPAEREALAESTAIASGNIGNHNAPYPYSPWSQRGAAAPIAPYIIKGGTYVGNATGQDLVFRAPVNWLFIRPLTGNLGGTIWFSPMHTSHREFAEGVAAHVTADVDPAYVGGTGTDVQQQQYRVRIAGNNAQSNANAVTYQYIAVMDPGMRFMLNAAFSQRGASGNALATKVNTLVSEAFAPDWAFIFTEGITANTGDLLFAKGPGHAGTNTIVRFSAPGTVADALDMGTGVITSLAALHALAVGAHQVFSLWRRDDGSQDTGIPRVVNIGSYIGDGIASRSINLAPAANRRPMFVMVFSGAATSVWRDPSHVGTNSSNHLGADVATGITAGGIDSFTVGSTLNTSSVVYNYFVLFGPEGCTGNNGWGCNGEVVPVEPAAVPGAYPEDPVPFEPGDDDGDGGGGGGGGTPNPFPGGPPTVPPDILNCPTWATYMGNVALSRIGVKKQISDVSDDPSEEAYKIRLVYQMDLERTLRDYPWAFATRYANLVLVAGTATAPVNRDWQYSYRAPSDMLFARRLVSQDPDESRKWDIDPPKFRSSADTTGGLIYADIAIDSAASELVHLEYTAQLTCTISAADALFRDAFCWRLAASLALSLARDKGMAQDMLEMYAFTLREAKVADANEGQKEDTPGDAPWITGR